MGGLLGETVHSATCLRGLRRGRRIIFAALLSVFLGEISPFHAFMLSSNFELSSVKAFVLHVRQIVNFAALNHLTAIWMTDKKKNWIKSPWTIAIFSAVIGPLLYDFLKEKPILSTFLSILTFDLKVWWVLLALGAVFFWLRSYVKRMNRKLRAAVREYRDDEINGRRWTWTWEWSNYEREWCVEKLKCYCPDCNTPLTAKFLGEKTLFDCPRCNFQELNDRSLNFDRISRIICDNYDRKEKQKNENLTNVEPKK